MSNLRINIILQGVDDKCRLAYATRRMLTGIIFPYHILVLYLKIATKTTLYWGTDGTVAFDLQILAYIVR